MRSCGRWCYTGAIFLFIVVSACSNVSSDDPVEPASLTLRPRYSHCSWHVQVPSVSKLCLMMSNYSKEVFVFISGVLGIVLTGLMFMSWSPVYMQHWDELSRNWIRQLQNISQPPVCRPVRDIVLLKTHKTGGSTLQNIMYRYGDERNLTFALPTHENYFGSPEHFSKSFVMKLPGTTKFNILANHARYSSKGFKKVMPADTVYITSIRHPASQFESLYEYYKFSSRFHVPIKAFATNPSKFYEKSKSKSKAMRQSGVNPMLFDLGLHKQFLQDMTRIQHKVRDLEKHFSFVLIAEYFDESLVLMKDFLCWSLADVAYFKVNARVEEQVVELDEDTKHNLTRWNEGDMLLYTHFNDTLWKKIEAYGYERLKSEVKKLREMIERLKVKCLGNGDNIRRAHGGKTIVLKYDTKKISDSWEDNFLCGSLTRKPLDYLKRLKDKMKKMYGRGT